MIDDCTKHRIFVHRDEMGLISDVSFDGIPVTEFVVLDETNWGMCPVCEEEYYGNNCPDCGYKDGDGFDKMIKLYKKRFPIGE